MRVTNEVYFRRDYKAVRDKLKGLATWARVMREHRERMRRQQKARQLWGKTIEKVRKRVRAERARGERVDAAVSSDVGANDGAGEPGPSEGRGAQRNDPMTDGTYREARQWTRHEGRRLATRRMATKDGARVGIRLWWWLAEGAACSTGPVACSVAAAGGGWATADADGRWRRLPGSYPPLRNPIKSPSGVRHGLSMMPVVGPGVRFRRGPNSFGSEFGPNSRIREIEFAYNGCSQWAPNSFGTDFGRLRARPNSAEFRNASLGGPLLQ